MTRESDKAALVRRSSSADADHLSPADLERHARADDLYRQARAIRQSNRDLLLTLAEQSMELACQKDVNGEQYHRGMAAAMSLLAYHSAVNGRPEDALSEGTQALALLDDYEPSTIVSDVYDSTGWALFCRGDFVEAIEVLKRAHSVAVETGDGQAQADALNSLASVQSTAGDPHEALESHLEALSLHESAGNGLGAALVRNNLAYTHLALGDSRSALTAAMKSFEYVSEHANQDVESAVLDTIATVYLAMGDFETALQWAERGLVLARDGGLSRTEGDSLTTIGRIALEQERYGDALSAVEESLALAVKHRRRVEEYTCHELLSEIHERRGDLEAALAEYRRFHDLERKRINDETDTRLEHLRVERQLDNARKDAEIHRLRSLALEQEVEERRIAQANLEAEASLDPLTGLYNRRHMSVIDEGLRAALSRNEPVCLALFDIDHFKHVNDTYGHLAGDRVLVSVALQLGLNSRSSDVPCRWGGDEFLVLLVGMDADAATEATERLRAAIEGTAIEPSTTGVKVTVSAGVASAAPGSDVHVATLIGRADRALYAAKHTGRNRVVVA